MKSFIIYKGQEFTIEWYYDDRAKVPHSNTLINCHSLEKINFFI